MACSDGPQRFLLVLARRVSISAPSTSRRARSLLEPVSSLRVGRSSRCAAPFATRACNAKRCRLPARNGGSRPQPMRDRSRSRGPPQCIRRGAIDDPQRDCRCASFVPAAPRSETSQAERAQRESERTRTTRVWTGFKRSIRPTTRQARHPPRLLHSSKRSSAGALHARASHSSSATHPPPFLQTNRSLRPPCRSPPC